MAPSRKLDASRPFDCSAREAHGLITGTQFQILRPMAPQPQAVLFEESSTDGWTGPGWSVTIDVAPGVTTTYQWYGGDYPVNEHYIHGACPYGKVGEVLWGREAWQVGYIGGVPAIRYAADGTLLRLKCGDSGRDLSTYPCKNWNRHYDLSDPQTPATPPRKMWRWMSRFGFKISAVKACRAADLVWLDAVSAGWSDHTDYKPSKQGGALVAHRTVSALDRMRADLDRIYPAKPYKNNLWLWVLDVDVKMEVPRVPSVAVQPELQGLV